MIDTRYEWIAELERLSPIIQSMKLRASLNNDAVYAERSPDQPVVHHDIDAY